MKMHLVPAQVAQLRRPQAVPVGDQDHGGVAVAVAVGLGGLDQLLDLGLGQMLARAQLGIRLPQRRLPLWCDLLTEKRTTAPMLMPFARYALWLLRVR